MKQLYALDDQDHATILAALRFYQEKGMGEPANRSDDIHEIATCGDTVISLDDHGIDMLCEEFNGGAITSMTEIEQILAGDTLVDDGEEEEEE